MSLKIREGFGVRHAGWGGAPPPPPPPTCNIKCNDGNECTSDSKNDCFCVNKLIPDKVKSDQTEGNCQTELCSGSRDNNGDIPPDSTEAGDCQISGCEDGSPTPVDDNGDKPRPEDNPDNYCKTCEDGGIVADASKDGKNLPSDECKVCEAGSSISMAVDVNGPKTVLINKANNYVASSVDGTLPSSTLSWNAVGGSVSGSGTTVSVTFNSASTSTSDLKTVKATCNGTNGSVDVCVVDIPALPTSLSSVNYQRTVISPTSSNWGETSPGGNPITFNVDVSAYYDSASDTWKAKVTQADSPYTIWWRLLPGVQPASAATATATNCAKMISDLQTLGYPSTPAQWYVASAVKAHEEVHVTELEQSLNPEFANMKTTIEGLSVPHVCGMDSVAVKAQIKALADYNFAVNTATSNASTTFWAIPNANTNAAEFAVVNPIIAAIKAKGAVSGWPASCR